MKSLHRTLVILCLSMLCGPLFAYTVYLKDGTRINAKNKYRIEGERAIIVLQNGTRTFIKAAEIDIRRTEEANKTNLGSAQLLEGGKVIDAQAGESAPQQPPQSLADFAASQRRAEREQARRTGPARSATAPAADKTRPVEFTSADHKPYRNIEVSQELGKRFRLQGVDDVRIFHGTDGKNLLLEITTNSEASVFVSLVVASRSLLSLQELHPGEAESFELMMLTSSRQPAGRFQLTQGLARLLAEGGADVSSFFVENVQF